MHRWRWLAFALWLPLSAQAQDRNLAPAAPAAGGDPARRVALVIGNGAYADAPLKNPVNDARAMAAALRDTGFEVIVRENADLRQMDEAVREFGRRLERARVGLFYFAGHGMQIKGRNFLIPVGANFEHEDEVAYRSLDAGQVLDKMDSARTPVNLMILDACRSNPFHRAFRARRQGLAEMEAPAGTLIAFATAPGSVALDGTGRHGVYTKHLLKQVDERGLPVEQVFKRVRIGVSEETRERQIPWESSSLREDFQFRPEKPAAATPPPAATEAAIELAFWNAIKDSKRADDYAAYLEQFPAGRFVALARSRHKALQGGAPPLRPIAPAAAPAPTLPVQAAAQPATTPSLPAQAVRPDATASAAGPAAQPAAASSDGAAPLFRLAGNELTAVDLSADGTKLAVASTRGTLLILDAERGLRRSRQSLGEALTAVRFAPDGRQVVVGTASGAIRLVDPASGKEAWRRRPHDERIARLVFSPDGRYLLAAAAQGAVELAATADGARVLRLDSAGLPLRDAQYSPDGRYVALVLGDERSQLVRVIEVGSGEARMVAAAAAASFSVNGRYLLAASGGHTPTLFDIASGRELRRFERYPLPIFAGAYAESGEYVATVDAEGRGRKLATADGRLVARVEGPRVQPRAVAFSPDVGRFALVDADGNLAVYRFRESP